MKPTITFKEYEDFDPAELYAIVRHIYLSSEFLSDDFDQKFLTIQQFHLHYHNILKHPASFLLVAMQGNKPMGYLLLEANPAVKLNHTAWLNMGIVEKSRNKGMGKLLVNAAIQKAVNTGLTEIIYLMVRADHAGALRLYKNAGFEKIATLEKDTKIDHEYYDGILLRKFLKNIPDLNSGIPD